VAEDEEKMLERIRDTCRDDGRYPFEAYIFVYQALDYTTHRVVGERRHVTGRELLEGIRRLAIEQFGPLSLMVLKHWGVRRTEDFGEIVWNLVQRDLMGKTDEDKREDFADAYSFDDAFAPERLLRQVNPRELAPPPRVSHRELPRAARATGAA
jgi:uncharacterized repeat protein (TIGR04138 family)